MELLFAKPPLFVPISPELISLLDRLGAVYLDTGESRGLVPGEHSSGPRRRLGAITKAGNAPARRILVDTALPLSVLIALMTLIVWGGIRAGLKPLELLQEEVADRAANDLTPIIMLTAKVEDVDRIVGLEVGADDYLPKPFNPRELLARIHAVLRRRPAQEAPGAPSKEAQVVSFGPFEFDLSLQNAKIATLGERVEDVFFITNAQRQPLTDPALCAQLQQAIVSQLEEANGAPATGSLNI